MVERWQRLEFLSQHPDLEVPECILQLVTHVLSRADAEYLVEFLEGKRLGLRDKQEDQEP